MDVSDLGQDHGVPIDPLSIQKIEIFRGPEALRYGSQAVGGVVEATNNRIPVRRAGRRLASPDPGRHDDGRPRARGRRLVRCRHPRFRDARRLLRPSCQRLFRPELPLSFPDRPGAVLQRQAAEFRLAFRGTGGGRLVPVRWRICGRRDLALHQRLSDSHARWCPDTTPASTWRRPRSPARASFVRNRPPSTSCASGSARSNISTTSSDWTTPAWIPRARPLTTMPRKPRPKSSSCR